MTASGADDRRAVIEMFNVSRETSERIDVIVRCLAEWSQTRNLIGPREMDVLWTRHIADSLQLCGLLSGRRRILDLGSGAGFPGLILAAALEGAESVTLVESVGKKAAFLRAASQEAGLPVTVVNQRIELVPYFDTDVVTARALAPLPKLLDLARPWLEKGAVGVFPKGQKWEEELTAAREKWTFSVETEVSRTSPAARILTVSEVRGPHDRDTNSCHRQSKGRRR